MQLLKNKRSLSSYLRYLSNLNSELVVLGQLRTVVLNYKNGNSIVHRKGNNRVNLGKQLIETTRPLDRR